MSQSSPRTLMDSVLEDLVTPLCGRYVISGQG